MITAQEALDRLKAGNQRFVSGDSNTNNDRQALRASLVDGQAPFAIILGCSDSRAPVEIIFDQDLGDLFTVRVAGNIAASSQIGSIEFAAAKFGTPLIVVLGHSSCGAVKATIEQLEQPTGAGSVSLQDLVDTIRPSVEPLFNSDLRNNAEELLNKAIEANVNATTKQLQNVSPILKGLIEEGKLNVIGAEYSLETGAVTFYE